MKADVYIATSAKGFRRQDGVAGYVIEAQTAKGPATLTVFGTFTDVTPNTAVLLTVKNALRRLNTECEVIFYLDNNYVASALTNGWAVSWKMNGWKNARGMEIVDSATWDEVLMLLRGREPHFVVGEPNKYKKYLQNETEKRKAKHDGSKQGGKH
jgi:ribonuclease HI